MKKFLALFVFAYFVSSCAELQSVANQFPATSGVLSSADIASGLRQALDKGISTQVVKLTATDGFYKNQLVKILLPAELRKVDQGLRAIGLGSLADEGLLLMNRAAEDAVKEATPIFISAVKGITFNDAKTILLGDKKAATYYLEQSTNSALYSKFNPVIRKSFDKVGAAKVWSNLITKYNSIPLVTKVNPDLTDYVTKQALEGVYKMIAIEEQNIRNNISARTSILMQRVFAVQYRK
jgi:hypothetical protein